MSLLGFPRFLTFHCFAAVNESLRGSSEPPSEVIELDIEQDISQSASLKTVAKYSLQGVINHVGSNYNRGHYIADILDRKSNRWRTFNDDIMTTLGSFRDLCAKRARTVYILSFQLEE